MKLRSLHLMTVALLALSACNMSKFNAPAGSEVDEGAFGIPFPAAGAADLIPVILLVPLLAFDRRGHRLGYGGGFYDRTLADLRAKGPILAIGVGYAFQEVDEVPSGAYDQRIDMIATETGGERLA